MKGVIPQNPVIIKDYGKVCFIEDELGFTVATSISFCHLMPGDLEWVGKVIGDTTINRETPTEGLSYDDAELLAMSCEKAIRDRDTLKRKRK